MHELARRGSSTRSLTGWLVGFGASVLADQVFFLSLTWAALQVCTTGEVGVVLAAGSIPRLLILLIGGAMADHSSPKRIIVVTDTGRAVVMALAAIVLMVGTMSAWQLVVVALAIGALDGLFLPSVGALPALIAPAHLLGRVAALRTVTQRVAMLVGGPLAGWLIYLYGPSAAFWGSAALFAISVLSLVLVTVPRTVGMRRAGSRTELDDADADEEPRGGGRPDLARRAVARSGMVETSRICTRRIVEGLRTVRRHPVLPWLLVLIAGMNVGFAGPVTAGLPMLAAEGHWGAQGAGFLLGGFGFGAAATGLSLVFVPWLPRAGLLAMASVFVMGVALTAVSWATTLPVAVAATVGLGLASGVFGTVVHAMVLTSTPESDLGRVMALVSLSIEGVVPISYAATGLLAGWVGVRGTFVVGGLVIAATAVLVFTRRRLRSFELVRPDRTAASSPLGDGSTRGVGLADGAVSEGTG